MVVDDPCCRGVAYNSYTFFLNQSLHSLEITTFQTRNAHDPRSLITPLCVSEKSTSCDMETSGHPNPPKQTFPVPGIAPAVKAYVRTDEASRSGSRRMFGRQMRTAPNMPPLQNRTDQRALAAPPMPADASLSVCTLRCECRQWTPSWRRCMGCSPPASRRDLLGPRPSEAPVATGFDGQGSHALQMRRTPPSHPLLFAKAHWMWMKPLQGLRHQPRSTACPAGSQRS